ncbi:hypothetical protein SAMN05444004_103272 [Jannaschia faecimaris]|uniref:Beta/Gamma crystallin n=1 Tax=Jannaschia faecimaris TaxID=1244108 RepID=A0A1H3N6L6_9RHOB|nr:hypothetical protein [Jannaschia faecimaris]SDY83859.1 hypothetical protein SAMN05444004_103272 [Jannaschia faecimaris]
MRLISAAAPLVVALGLTAQPVLAERVISAEEFEQMVAGKTLHFDRQDVPFGSEQYFDDKRVIWAFENGGECQRGIWFENRSGQICFVYDTDPAPQCWDFLEGDDGRFRARLDGSPPDQDLVTERVTREALDCPLPDLGV